MPETSPGPAPHHLEIIDSSWYAFLKSLIAHKGMDPYLQSEIINRRTAELDIMQSPLSLKGYLESVDLHTFLKELHAPNVKLLPEEAKHFTEKEADKRDQIILGYFGNGGVNRITDSVVDRMLSQPKLKGDAKILDVGAGSGFFTVRVASKLRRCLPEASFYAIDMTSAMLMALARREVTSPHSWALQRTSLEAFGTPESIWQYRRDSTPYSQP